MITHLQLTAIGFSFGIAGPCLLTCTPIVAAYLAGSRQDWPNIISGIFLFLSGRLAVYILLGLLAGISGAALRQFTSSSVSVFFRPLAGIVSIIFAVLVLTQRDESSCPAAGRARYKCGKGGLFILGASLGLAPCAPLVAVLFDIALMSKNAVDGGSYAMSFGIGTFLSGLLAISVFTGMIKFIPQKFLKSRLSGLIFKVVCATLLMIFGIWLII